jgi:hypothetical protein
MRSNDRADDLLRALEGLAALTPDPARGDRVRARCHAALARGQRRVVRSAPAEGSVVRGLGPTLVGGLCVIYFLTLVGNALRLHGVL